MGELKRDLGGASKSGIDFLGLPEPMRAKIKGSVVFEPLSESQALDTAGKAYDMITRRGVGRKNPRENDRVVSALKKRLVAGRPLSFTIFWGGFKDSCGGGSDRADDEVLGHVRGVLDKVSESLRVPVEANLLFCNAHTLINGKSLEDSERYLNSGLGGGLSGLSKKHGFNIIPLNQEYLRSSWVGREKEFDEIMGEGRDSGLKDFSSFIRGLEEGESLSNRLISASKRHSEYVGAGDEAGGLVSAATYYAFRSFEARLLSVKYPDTVFIGFNDPVTGVVHPDATVYWWARKRGDGRTPWFAGQAGL
jgi:hypothetical protein